MRRRRPPLAIATEQAIDDDAREKDWHCEEIGKGFYCYWSGKGILVQQNKYKA